MYTLTVMFATFLVAWVLAMKYYGMEKDQAVGAMQVVIDALREQLAEMRKYSDD